MAKKRLTDEEAFELLVKEHTKAGLAKAAGLSNQRSAWRWKTIPHKHARKIADALGLPMSRVLPSISD